MSWAITAVAAAVVVGAAVSYKNGQDQNKASKRAYAQAEQNALKQEQAANDAAKAADEATNAANMKTPDTAAMMSSAMLSGKSGVSGTMLTGPQGVSKDKLGIQKSTLLGA